MTDRKDYIRKNKPAPVIAFDRVYGGGKNFDKTAKVQDKDAYLRDQGIAKPAAVQLASQYYAQWRVRATQNTPGGAVLVKKELKEMDLWLSDIIDVVISRRYKHLLVYYLFRDHAC